VPLVPGISGQPHLKPEKAIQNGILFPTTISIIVRFFFDVAKCSCGGWKGCYPIQISGEIFEPFVYLSCDVLLSSWFRNKHISSSCITFFSSKKNTSENDETSMGL